MTLSCQRDGVRVVTWPLLSPLLALGTDIDECEDLGEPICGAWRCENSPGSYRCVLGCQPGFQMAPTGDCIGEWGGGVRAGRPRTTSTFHVPS